MAEILEYSLVVMVSALFVFGSVATYDTFSGFTTGLELRIATSAISKLANEAILDGNATGVVAVPASTLSCEGGTLTLSTGNQSQEARVQAECSFSLALRNGGDTIGFHYRAAELSATVS